MIKDHFTTMSCEPFFSVLHPSERCAAAAGDVANTIAGDVQNLRPSNSLSKKQPKPTMDGKNVDINNSKLAAVSWSRL